jgi:hypothetical protein
MTLAMADIERLSIAERIQLVEDIWDTIATAPASPDGPTMKRTYSSFTLKEAMQLLGREILLRWALPPSPRPPSAFLHEDLRRLNVFELENTEQAKMLLIDALFAEIVPDYPELKVWKAEALETDLLTGLTDYLVAPRRAYLATPLLCVVEAKRDDFVQGRAQCLAEMAACQWQNRQESHETDVFGIVSNGQSWQFYKLTHAGDIYETEQYAMSDLPRLLGALNHVCAECAQNVPRHGGTGLPLGGHGVGDTSGCFLPGV